MNSLIQEMFVDDHYEVQNKFTKNSRKGLSMTLNAYSMWILLKIQKSPLVTLIRSVI